MDVRFDFGADRFHSPKVLIQFRNESWIFCDVPFFISVLIAASLFTSVKFRWADLLRGHMEMDVVVLPNVGRR
jgi:hypothetical protein